MMHAVLMESITVRFWWQLTYCYCYSNGFCTVRIHSSIDRISFIVMIYMETFHLIYIYIYIQIYMFHGGGVGLWGGVSQQECTMELICSSIEYLAFSFSTLSKSGGLLGALPIWIHNPINSSKDCRFACSTVEYSGIKWVDIRTILLATPFPVLPWL